MSDTECPPEVAQLIDRAVGSLDHVEVIRVLRAVPNASTSATANVDDLASRLHIDRETVANVLHDLELAGLIRESDGAYEYAASPADRATVDALMEIYESRPITLVRAMQARPRPLQSFASVFRLRRKD
jgi:hypothetical protein